MNSKFKLAAAAFGLATIGAAMPASAQITFYEHDGYRGRTFTANGAVPDFTRYGFNDRASSVVVDRGRWEVCEDARYGGRCTVLRRGSYDSLGYLGFSDRISSVRPANSNTNYSYDPEPLSAPSYEWRRRPSERTFEAQVTSVRAVVGPPDRRCWVERQQVVEPGRGGNNVGGAIAGAIIGGILGHQVGSGRGNDAATAAGALAGAAIGNNAGRGGDTVYDRDVRRCANVPNERPDYWDVTYNFRGTEHHLQMTAPPGPTITVNGNGEPRQ